MMALHAFGPRIAVVDPPVERTLPSGLVVISSEVDVATGVVINNPAMDNVDGDIVTLSEAFGIPPEAIQMAGVGSQVLKRGTLVYYHKEAGIKIRDLIIVELRAVLAWED